MKIFIFSFNAACSAILAAIFLWFTDDSLTTWVGMGYLFVASIWLSSWIRKKHSKVKRSLGQWIIQFAISLLWWPTALLAGFLGLFVAQPFASSLLINSALMYGFASIAAIGMGILSLRADGAELSIRFFLSLIAVNAIVLAASLVIYNRFQRPPFHLSNHFEAWLILIIIVPLAAANAGFFGTAFPEIAQRSDFTSS